MISALVLGQGLIFRGQEVHQELFLEFLTYTNKETNCAHTHIHTWCGYKITALMLEHFLFRKLHNRNVVTFNVLHSLSLNHSMRIFHCWKQCCRSSSDSLFMRSVVFAFTASTDSDLVPFKADLIFGNKKKSHGTRSGEYGGCSNKMILCFVKNVLTDRALYANALSW